MLVTTSTLVNMSCMMIPLPLMMIVSAIMAMLVTHSDLHNGMSRRPNLKAGTTSGYSHGQKDHGSRHQ